MAVRWVERPATEATNRKRPVLLVTKTAADAARHLGISPDQLADMAYTGAALTHPQANRRHGQFMLKVAGDTVEGVWPFKPVAAVHVCDAGCRHGERPPSAIERLARAQHGGTITGRWTRKEFDCPICEGDGTTCMECNGRGTIHRTQEEYDRLLEIAATAVRN